MGNDDDLTPAEQQELVRYLDQMGAGAGSPQLERDKSMVGFFRDVVDAFKESVRVGNLDVETELFSVRNYLDTAHYADKMGLENVGKFLEEEALIINNTSLSKEGFLIKAAITTKRESKTLLGEDKKRKKKGWQLFGGKKEGEE